MNDKPYPFEESSSEIGNAMVSYCQSTEVTRLATDSSLPRIKKLFLWKIVTDKNCYLIIPKGSTSNSGELYHNQSTLRSDPSARDNDSASIFPVSNVRQGEFLTHPTPMNTFFDFEDPTIRKIVAWSSEDVRHFANDIHPEVRSVVAARGFFHERYVLDPSSKVRIQVARTGVKEICKQLLDDNIPDVLVEIAKRGFLDEELLEKKNKNIEHHYVFNRKHIEKLIFSNHVGIRKHIAEVCDKKIVEQLICDPSPLVREAIARRKMFLSILKKDLNEEVRTTVAAFIEDPYELMKDSSIQVVEAAMTNMFDKLTKIHSENNVFKKSIFCAKYAKAIECYDSYLEKLQDKHSEIVTNFANNYSGIIIP